MSTILAVSCNGCGTAAYVDCQCPVLGHDPAVARAHHPHCPFADLGANVTCPPGSGCCDGSDHPGVSHDAHANACPQIDKGTHGDCPEPASCKSWHSMNGHNLILAAGDQPPPCPGGHCHQGLPDCTVCRTVTITVLPGSVAVTPATGA
jgi:hypothetical protein